MATNEFVDFVSEELRAQGKDLPQPVEAAQREPSVTPEIDAAAQRAADEIKSIHDKAREEILRSEFENPPAPVNAQGTLDHKFLGLVKQLVVWTDASKTKPDYEKSLQLRALAYEGYEKLKSGRPQPERPVSQDEIAAAIQNRIQNSRSAPDIAFNRHVH